MDREFFCICAENGVSHEKTCYKAHPIRYLRCTASKRLAGRSLGALPIAWGGFPVRMGCPWGAVLGYHGMCPGTATAGGCFCGPLIGSTTNRMGRFPLSDVPPGCGRSFRMLWQVPCFPRPSPKQLCRHNVFFEKRHHAFFRGMPEIKQTVGLVRIVHSQRFFILLFSLRLVNRRRFSFSAGPRLHRLARHFDDVLHFLFCGRPMRPPLPQTVPLDSDLLQTRRGQTSAFGVSLLSFRAFVCSFRPLRAACSEAHRSLLDPPLLRSTPAPGTVLTRGTPTTLRKPHGHALFSYFGARAVLFAKLRLFHMKLFSPSHALLRRTRSAFGGVLPSFFCFCSAAELNLPVTPNARHTPPFWGYGCGFQQSRPAHFSPVRPPHPNRASPAPRGRSCSKTAARLWQ